MAFIKSQNIKMFPSILRGTNPDAVDQGIRWDVDARLNNEKNLTSLSNRFTTVESFVHKYVEKDFYPSSSPYFVENDTITFSIHGYCFKLYKVSDYIDQFSNKRGMAARIRITSLDTEIHTVEGDEPNHYSAINLVGFKGTDPDQDTSFNTYLDYSDNGEDYNFLGIYLYEPAENESITNSYRYIDEESQQVVEDFTLILFLNTGDGFEVPKSAYIKFLSQDLGYTNPETHVVTPFDQYLDEWREEADQAISTALEPVDEKLDEIDIRIKAIEKIEDRLNLSDELTKAQLLDIMNGKSYYKLFNGIQPAEDEFSGAIAAYGPVYVYDPDTLEYIVVPTPVYAAWDNYYVKDKLIAGKQYIITDLASTFDVIVFANDADAISGYARARYNSNSGNDEWPEGYILQIKLTKEDNIITNITYDVVVENLKDLIGAYNDKTTYYITNVQTVEVDF